MQVAVRMFGRQLERHFRACDAAASYTLDAYFRGSDVHARDEVAQPGFRETDVQQRTQRHVAADPGEWIEDESPQQSLLPEY
jgi:hypothetical protein